MGENNSITITFPFKWSAANHLFQSPWKVLISHALKVKCYRYWKLVHRSLTSKCRKVSKKFEWANTLWTRRMDSKECSISIHRHIGRGSNRQISIRTDALISSLPSQVQVLVHHCHKHNIADCPLQRYGFWRCRTWYSFDFLSRSAVNPSTSLLFYLSNEFLVIILAWNK